LKSNCSSKAIYCGSDRLAFGGGHDIHVYDNCNATSNHYTNINSSFENTTQIDATCVMDGAKNFTVQEIEVFEIHE
jgi:hypothetical protein